ncbi:MAG: pyridoxamine 5'-phosphate oxidase family protein [Chloroflexota bacterium]
MPAMDQETLNAFLSSDVLCRLGCLDDDGAPYVVPVWFQYVNDGFYIIPRAKSLWATYLKRDERVSLCIDSESGERVLAKGQATLVEESNVGGQWVEIARDMAFRYRGQAGLDYLEKTLDEPRWLFFITPIKMTTWQGGGWAKHYKHSDW